MESKNISSHDEHMNDTLRKGYAELAAGRWNFAQIVFDKALMLDDQCGEAYVGKILSGMQFKNANDAAQNGRLGELYSELFFSDAKIKRAVLADSTLKNEIFECGYNYADKQSFDDMKLVLEFLGKQGYKEAANKMYMFNSYAELENKAKKYRDEYAQKLWAETAGIEIKTSAKKSGKKKLINNKEKVREEYPGIFRELESLDYAYREAQATDKFGTTEWIILILLFIYVWPIALIYLIHKKRKGGKDPAKMSELEKRFSSLKEKYKELNEELRFTLETMLEEDIQTFEYEAAGLNMMVGYGKTVIEKYSRL